MKRYLLLLSLLAVLCAPAEVDWRAGVEAYERGDYVTAYREWLPLAEQAMIWVSSMSWSPVRGSE